MENMIRDEYIGLGPGKGMKEFKKATREGDDEEEEKPGKIEK